LPETADRCDARDCTNFVTWAAVDSVALLLPALDAIVTALALSLPALDTIVTALALSLPPAP
jgi:hypothetical protein